MKEIVLITISGQDRPGITAEITGVLAKYNVTVLDIGQSVNHHALSLGLLIESSSELSGCSLFKDLLFKGHELNLIVRFTPVSEEDYESWVAGQGRPRHIVTLLGRQITARHLAGVSEIVSKLGFNIEEIVRLSGRISLAKPETNRHGASIQLTLSGQADDVPAMHGEFFKVSQNLGIDVAVQEDNLYRRSRRLVCFDMDSTLIQTEVIDELALRAGVGEQVSAITESAMRGELDFSESFRKRMALLEGLEESVLKEIAEKLPLTDGAEKLIKTFRHFGYKVAILSGGFTYFANHLKETIGIDYVYANELDIKNGKLTGKVKGSIIDGNQKAKLLIQLAEKEGINPEQVIAVGDGANDLPMLSIAGLGIAFHAKPIVKEKARHSIATLGLDSILYLLGMRDIDLEKLDLD